MELVPALKAIGVLLAAVAGWLALAAVALDVLFRIAAPRQGQLPAAAHAPGPRLPAATVAMRSSDLASRR